MTDADLGSLLIAAITDPRPPISALQEIPTGGSPAEEALAGYVTAVNLLIEAAEIDCDLRWRYRQEIYAAEIGRLQSEGGTADPAVIEKVNTHLAHTELSDRYCAAVKKIARTSGECVFDIMSAIRAHLRQLDGAPTVLCRGGNNRTEVITWLAAAVEEINAQTQRLIDKYHPEAFRPRVLGPHLISTPPSGRTKCTDRAPGQPIS